METSDMICSYQWMDEPYEDRDFIDEMFENDPSLMTIDEVSYQERAKNAILSIEVLDVERYIKQNELQEITNPSFFNGNGVPTSDGLLSNEIFGITEYERKGTFAYIDLGELFMDPSCYKMLTRLDNKIDKIASGMTKFKVNSEGDLVEDPNGGTGIRWFRDVFPKIKFKSTGSRVRDMRIKYIKHNYKEGKMFISKYIVIPAFYRDVNTTGKHTGVGQINTFYVNLITASRAIKENDNYGFSMADTTCYRIQKTLKAIYDWFCGNTNPDIKDKGSGLRGKYGIIRANMGYTSDYSSRLVMSAPELKFETIDDLMVDLDRSAIPLAAIAADFVPFMMFHIRKYFENIFLNVTDMESIDKDGNSVHLKLVDNPMLYFTDEIIQENLKQFVYSHDTRFKPIKIPLKDTSKNYYLAFKGKRWDLKKNCESSEPITSRALTWVDVIYVSAVRATEGKRIAFTRYPIDSYFNTIYTGIEVSSTKETEPVIFDGELYKWYPKIRQEDIGKPSANKFIDTMQISNLYLKGMGGDYDGDMGQVKGSFFNETNEELENFTNSKANFITMGCANNRVSGNEAVQSLYNLTLVLNSDKDKLTNPTF